MKSEQGWSHGWDWEDKGPPTGEPDPANQNEFFPKKAIYYRQNVSWISSVVLVAGLRRSHRWRSRMWRSWAVVVTRGVRLCGRLAKLSKTMLVAAYGRWMNIKLSGNSSGGHSCSQHADCISLKTWDIYSIVFVTKLHILEWPCIVPSTKCTCVMIMLFNQLLYMPHLPGG
jgi:hypothetical protein